MTEELPVQDKGARRLLPFEADRLYDAGAPVDICEALHFPPVISGTTLDRVNYKATLAERYRAYRAQLQFRATGLSNTCGSYVVSPGMVMSVVDVQPVELSQCRLHGQDIVEFHFRLSGLMLLLGGWGNVRVSGPACLLWYQATGCDDTVARFCSPNEVRESWVSLYCDRAWLLGTGGASAAALLDGFAAGNVRTSVPQFRTCALGEALPILEDIFCMAQRAEPDWLITIAKAHELLHLVLRNAQFLRLTDSLIPPISPRDRRCITVAREILYKEFIAPPKLLDLARRVGLNGSRLGAGFKVLFGETISSFVRRQRLELALKLLATGDFQVREVARKTGYGHHSTFTAAFIRHFGRAPKVARRSGS